MLEDFINGEYNSPPNKRRQLTIDQLTDIALRSIHSLGGAEVKHGDLKSDELRVLADQAIDALHETGDPFSGDDWAVMQVVRAFRDEHPDDEDEPLTEEWFKEQGAVWKERGYGRWVLGPFQWYECRAYTCAMIDGPDKCVEVHTRGQLRKAMEAFGMPLGGK